MSCLTIWFLLIHEDKIQTNLLGIIFTINDFIRNRYRNKNKIDYKAMHTGQEILLTEGSTEVSKHIATEEHDKNDVTITAVSYDQNWYTRGIREANEICRRKPELNKDGGRFHIKPIYDNIIESHDEEGQRGTPFPNQDNSWKWWTSDTEIDWGNNNNISEKQNSLNTV